MADAPKRTEGTAGPNRERRGDRDEGLALIVGIRVLQFLIIIALMLFTSYFGASCLNWVGFRPLPHGHSEVMARATRADV
jgi:hypothetical protein